MIFGGVQLSDIKVADIAAEAGIGKGTIYEYFSSRDHIFNELLLYEFSIIKDSFKLILEKKIGFKEKLYELLVIASAKSGETKLLLDAFAESGGISRKTDTIMFCGNSLTELAKRLLKDAEEEGCIPIQNNDFSWRCAFTHGIVSVLIYGNGPHLLPGYTKEQAFMKIVNEVVMLLSSGEKS